MARVSSPTDPPQEAPPAVSDAGRLAVLESTGLLDSEAEEAFDRITKLAQRLLDVPVALVSLVDRNRQFFKSQLGLPEPWASLRETPLSHSFCQYAVVTRERLVVVDAHRNELLRNNGAVDDLGVTAYAGAPLQLESGDVLGTLCVIDHEPRDWQDWELAILDDLTAIVVTEIEARVLSRRARAIVDLAHRLQQPLDKMQRAFEELTGLARRLDDPLLDRYVDGAAERLATVARLADDLRGITDSGAGRLPAVEQVDLCRRVRRASDLAAASAQTARLSTDLPDHPVRVAADGAGLEMAIHAMLVTALNHLGADGKVEVTVTGHSDDALLDVWSPGHPLPLANLGRLIEQFRHALGDTAAGGVVALRTHRGVSTAETERATITTSAESTTLHVRIPSAAGLTEQPEDADREVDGPEDA